MGLSKSHLLPLPKVSKPLRARILDEFCQVCGYNRKYAIRLLNGQRHKNPDKPQGRRPAWSEVILSYGHLGGGWLSVLGAPQSSPTVMAPLGPKTLRYLGPNPKAAALDQPRHHRPPTQAQKTPTQKQTLRTHQTRHSAQTSHPHQNRLLGCKNPRLYRNRSGLALGQLCFGGVHSLAQCYRHPLHLGRKPRHNGQKPDRCSQCHARD